MIYASIIFGVLILALMFLSSHISNNSNDNFDIGMTLGFLLAILIIIEIYLDANIMKKPTPFAFDVYRGNTELEVISVNGTVTDTIVVFKN